MQMERISAAKRQLCPDGGDIAGIDATANHQLRPTGRQKRLQLGDALRISLGLPAENDAVIAALGEGRAAA